MEACVDVCPESNGVPEFGVLFKAFLLLLVLFPEEGGDANPLFIVALAVEVAGQGYDFTAASTREMTVQTHVVRQVVGFHFLDIRCGVGRKLFIPPVPILFHLEEEDWGNGLEERVVLAPEKSHDAIRMNQCSHDVKNDEHTVWVFFRLVRDAAGLYDHGLLGRMLRVLPHMHYAGHFTCDAELEVDGFPVGAGEDVRARRAAHEVVHAAVRREEQPRCWHTSFFCVLASGMRSTSLTGVSLRVFEESRAL